MHSVKMMRHYEVTPIVILDGCPLPGKEGTNAGRREKREAQLEKGKEVIGPPSFHAVDLENVKMNVVEVY